MFWLQATSSCKNIVNATVEEDHVTLLFDFAIAVRSIKWFNEEILWLCLIGYFKLMIYKHLCFSLFSP